MDPWNGVEDREDAIDLTTSLGEPPRADFMMEPVPVPALDTPLRLLPDAIEPESIWKRWHFLAIALALVAGFFCFTDRFWAPAPGRPGIDENGYLVGGRNIARHFTTGFKPTDDFQYVGAMWVRTADEDHVPSIPGFPWLARMLTVHTQAGWYYPKYPAGSSFLYAIAIWIGGDKHGREWAFYVSPICMALAMLATFLIARAVAGSFYGLLAMIVMACGPTTLEMVNLPNSHPSALCMVTWGMFFLLRWWQTGSIWRGVLAGLLLGYAVTIRYSEALLLFPLYPLDQILSDTGLKIDHPIAWQFIKIARLLPIGPLGMAAILSVRWSRPRSYWRSAIPVLAWAVPVGALVTYNWFAMGHVTGYDVTNESIGFTTKEFLRKWDFTIHEVYLYGLMFTMPLGILGLVLMFRRSWRVALLLTLWFLPGTLLYNAYYWGEQAPGIGFLRFFLTFFPPLIIAGMWLLHSAGIGAGDGKSRWRGSIAAPLTGGILTAATAVIAVHFTIPDMERQHRGNLNLSYSARQILAKVKTVRSGKPITPMVFADWGMFPQLLQYMQFMSDCDWYPSNAFEPQAGGGFGFLGMMQKGQGNDAPLLLQRERIDYMAAVYNKKSAAFLVGEQHRLIHAALDKGYPVYAVLTAIQEQQFKRQFINEDLEAKTLDLWTEPCDTTPRDLSPEAERTGQGLARAPSSPLSPRNQLGNDTIIPWSRQELTLFEIRRKPAAT